LDLIPDHPDMLCTDPKGTRHELKELTTTGVLLPCGAPGSSTNKLTLNPDSSPYYPKNEIGFYAWPDGRGLCLSPKAKPGQDISLDSYIIIDGVKEPAGSITLHVMYPS
jgi:hypothetical protein